MLDKRYKVTEETVLEILNLRDQGWKFQKIADKFDLNISTIYYWGNADYRQKQREKNRKRMHDTEQDKIKAREHAKIRYYKKSKADHFRDRIKRSIRENNYIIAGKKRSYWQANYPEYFENRPSAKLDGVL